MINLTQRYNDLCFNAKRSKHYSFLLFTYNGECLAYALSTNVTTRTLDTMSLILTSLFGLHFLFRLPRWNLSISQKFLFYYEMILHYYFKLITHNYKFWHAIIIIRDWFEFPSHLFHKSSSREKKRERTLNTTTLYSWVQEETLELKESTK